MLDYAKPSTPGRQAHKFMWALGAALIEHFLVFGVYAAALDGGRLASMCAAVSIGFWVVVLFIARRRYRPSTLDLAFVAMGYPLMLFPCIYVVRGFL